MTSSTAYMKEWYAKHPLALAGNRDHLTRLRWKRKRALIKLKGGKCEDCGYAGSPAALEFDHRNPKTKYRCVSTLLACKWESLLVEVMKCDLVCSNCHAIRTDKRKRRK